MKGCANRTKRKALVFSICMRSDLEAKKLKARVQELEAFWQHMTGSGFRFSMLSGEENEGDVHRKKAIAVAWCNYISVIFPPWNIAIRVSDQDLLFDK